MKEDGHMMTGLAYDGLNVYVSVLWLIWNFESLVDLASAKN
jgi:hypothetical protein